MFTPNLKYLYLDNNKISNYHRYDQIWMKKPGSEQQELEGDGKEVNFYGWVNLVNLEYTLDDEKMTIMKIGAVRGVRARWRASGVLYR